MDVLWADGQLRDRYLNISLGTRAWGRPVARKFVQRVDYLIGAATWKDVSALQSLRLHRLRGRREGQWAIDLNSGWWLLVAYDEDENTVTVEEVTNHYDD